MKKIYAIILAFALAVLGAVSFTACSTDEVSKVKALGIDLTTEQYGIAVKKGDTELLNSVNAFLTEKDTEIKAIMNKYMAEGVDLQSDKFGMDLQTESKNPDNELLVATELGFAPFEYKIGNKIAGIDMEVAQLFADYIGKTLVVVHMDFDAVVTSVADGSYDIGFAGLTITDERKEVVDFSNPYIDATQTLVLKENDDTFASCITKEDVEAVFAKLSGAAAQCGGQKGTTSYFYVNGDESFGYDGFDNLTFNNYDNAALAVQDMLNGNMAFVVVDKATANALVASYNK